MFLLPYCLEKFPLFTINIIYKSYITFSQNSIFKKCIIVSSKKPKIKIQFVDINIKISQFQALQKSIVRIPKILTKLSCLLHRTIFTACEEKFKCFVYDRHMSV